MEKGFAILILILIYRLWDESFGVIIESRALIEQSYVTNVIRRMDDRSTNDLCALPKEMKFAICDLVITFLNNKIEFRNGLSNTPNSLYFNKSAAYYRKTDCVKVKLKFFGEFSRYNEIIMQDVLPCYGRNEPMRTSWDVDDNLEILYLSKELEQDSVYVYAHIKLVNTEWWECYRLIQNLDISELPGKEITWDDVQEELKSLENLSINYNFSEIEINYTREIVLKEMRGDPVCDMDREKKMSLCQYLLRDQLYIFSEDAFDGRSTDCVESPITFMGLFTAPYNNVEIKRKIYPCYGMYPNNNDNNDNNAKPIFYLSGGYRRNSALIFAWYDCESDDCIFRFYSFVENISATYIPIDSETVDPDKPIASFESGESSEIRDLTAQITKLYTSTKE